MLNSSPDQGDKAFRGLGNALQFRLIDLFAIVTLCALVLAMAAPFLRRVPPDEYVTLFAVGCGQLLTVVIVMRWAASKRNKLLRKSGARIGIGYCGEIPWKHWPVARSLLTMLFIAMLQVSFALGVTAGSRAESLSPGMLIYEVQLCALVGLAIPRFVWRVYPNSMEFFENGVSLSGINLVPWKLISVRDSQFFPDRIVVVVRSEDGSMGADTFLVQVAHRLRDAIFSASKASID